MQKRVSALIHDQDFRAPSPIPLSRRLMSVRRDYFGVSGVIVMETISEWYCCALASRPLWMRHRANTKQRDSSWPRALSPHRSESGPGFMKKQQLLLSISLSLLFLLQPTVLDLSFLFARRSYSASNTDMTFWVILIKSSPLRQQPIT